MNCYFLVNKLCSALCDPVDCSPPGLSVHGILQARYWSGLPLPTPGHLPSPEFEPTYHALTADSLPLSQREVLKKGTATVKKKKVSISHKVNYILDSAVVLLSTFSREMNLCSIKNLYRNVHSSFICDS